MPAYPTLSKRLLSKRDLDDNPLDSSLKLGQADSGKPDPFDLGAWSFVVRCFLDDSGKEGDSSNPFVCMAGYLAEEPFWDIFQRAWAQRLLKYNISQVHMRDLIPLQGEYKELGWDYAKRDGVLREFIGLIKGSNLVGLGVGVDANAWRKIPKEITKEYGNTQEFCFARILRMLVDRLKKSVPGERVNIMFDCDPEFCPSRFRRWLDIKARDPVARLYLTSITFGDPSVFRPLQAADLLAWETRKELVQKAGGFDSTDRFEELFKITAWDALPDYASELWVGEDIDKMLEDLSNAERP